MESRGTGANTGLDALGWGLLQGILRSLRIIKDTRRPFPILHGVSSVIKPNR